MKLKILSITLIGFLLQVLFLLSKQLSKNNKLSTNENERLQYLSKKESINESKEKIFYDIMS